jgi:VIT1/CCC1 family predicted Fe2+/Mn2+ transporter
LVLGVASAHVDHKNVVLTAAAGLVAGAMSMAAGEYVSVHSQADTEAAELALERTELKTDDAGEHKELAAIYVERGLKPDLAHAKDELGITETLVARPIQAALTSALSFGIGAAIPLLVAILASSSSLIPLVSLTSLLFLTLLGGLAAHAGGANVFIGAARVTLWGVIAMAVTSAVGKLFGTAA